MKKSFILLAVALSFAACDQSKKPTAQELEQEIQRRVEAKLADERRADEERKLAEKAEDIRLREQQATDREAAAAEREKAAQEAEQQSRIQAEQARQAAIVPAATPIAAPVHNEEYDRNFPSPQGTQSAGNTYTVTYNTFYNSLDDDGEWFDTEDYGYVFRPHIVVRDNDWRPYSDGRWVYSDRGWTWLSNERFGWATYHYGRWTRIVGTGWVWVPGTEWAPAWVSWRTGDDVIGWAPLPPEAGFGSGDIDFDAYGVLGAAAFCFVNNRDFNRPQVALYAYRAPDNVTIINRTKNVTRIVKNKTTKVVINQGPQIAEIEKKGNIRIERAKLEKKQGGGKGQTGWKNGVVEVSVPDQKPEKPNAGKPMPDRVMKKLGKSKIQTDNPGTVQTMPARVPGKDAAVPLVSGTSTPTIDPAEAIEKEQRRQRKLRDQQNAPGNQRPAAPAQSAQPAPVQTMDAATPQTAAPAPRPDTSAAQADAIANEQRRVRKLQTDQDAQKEQRRQLRLQEEQQAQPQQRQQQQQQQQQPSQEAENEQRRRQAERAQRQQQQQPRAAQPQAQPVAPQQQIQRKQPQPAATPTPREEESNERNKNR